MRLVWSDPAVDDLGAIRDYIAHDSKHYAAQFIARILDAVERLESFPRLGRRVPEAMDQPGVREIIFRNYRIIYRVERQRLLILGVIHGSRDLSQLRPSPWEID